MEELCDESCTHNDNEKCATFHKNDDDLWNNTSSLFYASTDYYINNFTNLSELDREDNDFKKRSVKYDNALC